MNKNQEFEANLQKKQYSEKSPPLGLAIAGQCLTAKLFQILRKTFHGIAIYSLFGSSLWPSSLCDLNSKDGTDRHKSCDVTLLESRLFQNVIAVIFTWPAFIQELCDIVFNWIPSDDVNHICSNNW